MDERSAYFQNDFFDGLGDGTVDPVPVFSAGTFTDQLFPAAEHRRMVERLKAVSPGYPVQEYYGDYNHFVQNKRKEWADLCGTDRHVCRYDDYPGGNLNADPPTLTQSPDAQSGRGVTTRLNRFIDHFAKPPANPSQAAPSLDVTGSIQVCPQNAADLGAEPDEAGPRFSAATFDGLAPHSFVVDATGTQSTSSIVAGNQHAVNSDPVANSTPPKTGACPEESTPAGSGVATYDSQPLASDQTMMGRTRVTLPHTGMEIGTNNFELNARLYDVYPDGTQVLVDRGAKRVTNPNQTSILDLHGNGWRFEQGHKVRIEVAQDDGPYVKPSTQASSLTFSGARLDIPVREAPPGGGTGGDGSGSTGNGPEYPLPGGPAYPLPPGSVPRVDVRSPRLASSERSDRRFTISIRTGAGTTRSSVDAYQLQIRDTSARAGISRRIAAKKSQSRNVTMFRFRGRPNHTYRIRARARDRAGRFGPWDGSITVVPLDLGPARTRGVTFSRGWGRPRSRRAYEGRLRRAARRGRTLRARFRGDRLYVVGRTGPRGGKARITLNGRRRTVSFYSRRTRNRRVVASMRARRRGVNRLRIAVLGRKGGRAARGRRVELDALGYRRP